MSPVSYTWPTNLNKMIFYACPKFCRISAATRSTPGASFCLRPLNTFSNSSFKIKSPPPYYYLQLIFIFYEVDYSFTLVRALYIFYPPTNFISTFLWAASTSPILNRDSTSLHFTFIQLFEFFPARLLHSCIFFTHPSVLMFLYPSTVS